mmetsp:Transcript_16732/g.26063  ORF Transcript_16732/g.26063 Transcript_16732/m.26063 type:complete len:225 (-) Transcript_16732:715-1389(-)
MSLLQRRKRLRLRMKKCRNRWLSFRLKRNLLLKRRKLMCLHLARSRRLRLLLLRKGRRSAGAGGEGNRGLGQTHPGMAPPKLKRIRENNNQRLPVHGPILLPVAHRRNLRVVLLTIRRVQSRKDHRNLTRSPPPNQHHPLKPRPKVKLPLKNLPPNLKLHKTNAHLRQLYSSEIFPTQQKRRKFEPYLNLTAMPQVTKFLESHSIRIGGSVSLTLMGKLLWMRL